MNFLSKFNKCLLKQIEKVKSIDCDQFVVFPFISSFAFHLFSTFALKFKICLCFSVLCRAFHSI